MAKDSKKTPTVPKSVKPFDQHLPFKNPSFPQKPTFPKFNTRTSSAFRTQNRGGGGK